MGTRENTEHRDKHHAQQGVCIRGHTILYTEKTKPLIIRYSLIDYIADH